MMNMSGARGAKALKKDLGRGGGMVRDRPAGSEGGSIVSDHSLSGAIKELHKQHPHGGAGDYGSPSRSADDHDRHMPIHGLRPSGGR